MKPIVDNESDDSDSEIFRVKRPSSLKAKRRNGNDGMSSKHSDQQGLKRLKKNLNEGRSGQPIDCSKTSESGYKFNPSANHKVDIESSTRERYPKDNSIPISIRYKKLGNEDSSRQRDHHKKEWLQQSVMEPSPTEIGPKRLKVRGPSFLGL